MNRNKKVTQMQIDLKGYTIIGFIGHPNISMEPLKCRGRMFTRTPIYLPNYNISYNALVSQMLSIGYGGQYIILSELYKVKWFHGKLNIYDMLRSEIVLCDDYEVSIFGNNNEIQYENPPIDFFKLDEWLNTTVVVKNKIKTKRQIIDDIFQLYPGLFSSIPIHVPVPNTCMESICKKICCIIKTI